MKLRILVALGVFGMASMPSCGFCTAAADVSTEATKVDIVASAANEAVMEAEKKDAAPAAGAEKHEGKEVAADAAEAVKHDDAKKEGKSVDNAPLKSDDAAAPK
jgi:hypothetical protein